MKKVICLLLLSAFISPAIAEVKAPEWSEFCPKKYLNAEYKKHNWTAWYLTGSVLTISILGSPVGIPILIWNNKVESRNYWVNRRTEFNNEIQTCNMLQNNDQKIMCYMEIRKLEFHKNDINNGAYRTTVINNTMVLPNLWTGI